MQQRPKTARKPHSFRPLLFAPAQGPDALPPTVRPGAIKAKEAESHVRLRVASMIDLDHEGAEEMLDELCEEQLALGVALAAFDGAIVLRPQLPHDGSARAAFATLAERHQDLCAVRDALAQVQISTIDRRFHRLFVADQPLADYLRGVYAWLNAVIRALDHLAHSLRALAPDWALLRWRIEEAKNFHFDELFEPVRAAVAEVSAIPGAAHLAASIESLFAASSALEAHLDERFG